MNAHIKTGLLSLALLGFAACVTEPAETPVLEENEVVEETPAEAPIVTEGEAAGGVSQAETACLAAVAEQVGLPGTDLSVASAEMGETSTTVMVEVPDATALWQCNWGYRDGTPAVLDVFFSGDEGAL